MFDKMKKIAVEAVNATNPVNLIYGTVTKAKPIEIEVHSKLKLTEEFLDIAEHLTRHERIVSIEHQESANRELGDKTEMDFLDTDDKAAPTTSYKHSYLKLIFEDGLKKGDKVILVRMQGGHKYIVFDRYRDGENIWSYPQKQ
ncbi:Protein of unknown function (DUF2577) [Schinkia azotoformans MEV2011]|uniref:DUF2577 domain-containing protein n=1 Tax=Schinkia azotoformans MEV2011 TaxID=1348973 RepID=A0A072NT43_SCHAZ|nr:DUF2577 domain-containing protein [Schinkia azotoformans]KEF40402.1 Protein of unknown function (DUF2577) [Schinkia azotoformans MEV2011]MEC1696187.1 DUF2577 domain-containing protein [Schinkia azotoformans]MEC1725310.1 DUF2577 domain-containing protein [Schinkia azotoformans]MEC1779421.1 DUF2577 domain-containing protein [Schinkia azotoformans]MED4330094.1 DUF2577 domain-containing protein [Schinkia azotoformans]